MADARIACQVSRWPGRDPFCWVTAWRSRVAAAGYWAAIAAWFYGWSAAGPVDPPCWVAVPATASGSTQTPLTRKLPLAAVHSIWSGGPCTVMVIS
jgi:hypothetical protein